MSFEISERNMAVSPQDVETLFSALLEQYGEDLRDGQQTVRTIGGFWGDTQKTVVGAASLTRPTITGIPLNDGRVAFRCLWQADLAAAYDRGELPQVEQLTDEQLAALTLREEMP